MVALPNSRSVESPNQSHSKIRHIHIHIHDWFNLLVLCSYFSKFSSGTGGGIRKFSHFTPTDKGTASEADQLQEILKVGETSLCNIFYYFLFLHSTGESLTSRYSRNTDQRLHTSFSSGEFARLKPKDMSSPLVSDHSDNGRRVISPIRRRKIGRASCRERV